MPDQNADAEDQNRLIDLNEAVEIAYNGIELLDRVIAISRLEDNSSQIRVLTSDGAFLVDVSLEGDIVGGRLADENGGHWGKHPDCPVEDWQYEVMNHETRLGYWDWVEDKLRNAQNDQGDDGPFVHTPD